MKRLLIISLGFLSCFRASAQHFSGKTNALQLNYTTGVPSSVAPVINWRSPNLEATYSSEESIVIEATIQSEREIKWIDLEWRNGSDVKTKKISATMGGSRHLINQKVVLSPGTNTVTLVVENIDGARVSSSRSILSGAESIAEAVDINRKDYALIFAINNYDNFDDLVNPVNDAIAMESILKSKYGFQTELLLNLTHEEILAKITDYNLRKFNPQDQLFIFFAGHGVFDETLGEGYVVASNSLRDDRGKSSYVSHVLLRERINNIKCEHIFLAMDVCFGGTIDPVLARARATDTDETIDQQYLIKKLSKKTRKFLTSGSKEYVSDGVPGKHSPFAEKFILALKEIGGGTGRILSLLELQTYFLKLKSEPRFGSFGGDDPASDFLFVARQ